MPRLTDQDYLAARLRLRRYWIHQQIAFGYLNHREQWQLHDYFQLSTDWTDDQLIAHRGRISKERPSLPQQAGRALVKIDHVAPQAALMQVRNAKQAAATTVGDKRKPKQGGPLTVLSAINPEMSDAGLAQLVVAMVERRRLEEERPAEQDDA